MAEITDVVKKIKPLLQKGDRKLIIEKTGFSQATVYWLLSEKYQYVSAPRALKIVNCALKILRERSKENEKLLKEVDKLTQ